MSNRHHTLLSIAALALVTTAAQAGTIIEETFSGSADADLVGTPTPDGNNWTGGLGEHPEPEKPAAATTTPEASTTATTTPAAATTDTETTVAPRFSIKQDGSTGGIPFTAYHKFTLKPGQVYTLVAELSPTNKFDNQWLTAGFCVIAQDGNAAPQQDGATTYGQTVLSGSGYRYGWTGPDTKDMCELAGPGLHHGPVTVVLDTTKPADYTIEIFDGEGDSIHGPNSIGTPAISQVFIGNSGTQGTFGKFTLSDDAPEPKADTATKPEANDKE